MASTKDATSDSSFAACSAAGAVASHLISVAAWCHVVGAGDGMVSAMDLACQHLVGQHRAHAWYHLLPGLLQLDRQRELVPLVCHSDPWTAGKH